MLTKLDGAELDSIVVNNRLKKFYIREINSIEDFAYSVNKVSNAANIKKPQYLVNKKNKSAKNNN